MASWDFRKVDVINKGLGPTTVVTEDGEEMQLYVVPDGSPGRFRFVLIGKDFKDGRITSLKADEAGNIYFYYDAPGLMRYDPASQNYFAADVSLATAETPPTDYDFFNANLYILDIFLQGFQVIPYRKI